MRTGDRCTPARAPRRDARGFTYLGILLAVAFIGIALAAIATVWSLTAQRERETELLFIGDQYREAIARYYAASPQGIREYPRTLEDLVEDRRWPEALRHLRRVYADPITGEADWDLLRLPDGGIYGVASRSRATPLKRARFPVADAAFTEAECYCDWKFIYLSQVDQTLRTGLAPATEATARRAGGH
jgi:type II secretory pathway pseudopilin PulG